MWAERLTRLLTSDLRPLTSALGYAARRRQVRRGGSEGHAVATAALGLVERGIRRGAQPFAFARARGQFGDADARRDATDALRAERGDLPAQALGHFESARESRLRQDDGELVAADARARVYAARAGLDDVRDAP